MKLDHSDMSSVAAIAFGGFVGLLGTGILVERIEEAFDDDVRVQQVLDSRITIDGQTLRPIIDIRRDQRRIRVQVDGASPFDAPRTPSIYIDGERIDADVMSIEPQAGEIHIRTKPR